MAAPLTVGVIGLIREAAKGMKQARSVPTLLFSSPLSDQAHTLLFSSSIFWSANGEVQVICSVKT